MVLWLPILREVTVYDLSKTFSWRGNVTEVSLLNILKPSIAITLFSHDWLASSYHFARFKDCILMYNNLYYSSNLNNDLHLINRPSGWRLFVFALSCFLCLRWNSSTTKKSAKRNSNFTVISWKKPPTSSKPNCGTENTSTTTLPNPDTMTPSWQISYAVIGGLWNWWPVKLVVCEIGGMWNWWCVKLMVCEIGVTIYLSHLIQTGWFYLVASGLNKNIPFNENHAKSALSVIYENNVLKWVGCKWMNQ